MLLSNVHEENRLIRPEPADFAFEGPITNLLQSSSLSKYCQEREREREPSTFAANCSQIENGNKRKHSMTRDTKAAKN